jgi:predicted nucleic acid-binding protein
MLLDTSGLMCLFDRRELLHAQAVTVFGAAQRRLLHNYVLAEFVALVVARRAPRAPALAFDAALAESAEVELVWVDESLHHEATALLSSRLDKGWSLCDAVSFVLMRRRGETDALTTDHDFEQAGFIRLLKPSRL